MHIIFKILTPLVLLGLFKAISQSLYIGVLAGILLTLGFQYFLIIVYLREKNKNSQLTIKFVTDKIVQLVENGFKKTKDIEETTKRKHYVNKFSKELQLDLTNFQQQLDQDFNEAIHTTNPKEQNQTEEQKDQEQVNFIFENQQKTQPTKEGDVKIARKEFLKKIDLYQQFNEQVKEIELQHGQSLQDFDGLSVIFNKSFDQSTLYLVDQSVDHTIPIHEISEYGQQLIEKVAEISLNKQHSLLLPTWKSFKIQINRIGKCHVDLSKNLSQMITEQIQLLRKEYNLEIEELKKDKIKILADSQEITTYLQKVTTEYTLLDKDVKLQVSAYSDMNKKREDPSVLIKQEMRVKLVLSEMDSMKQKLFDAKEKNKDAFMKLNRLKSKIQDSQQQWEEQRLVYLKQGLQNQLMSFEDLSQQVLQLVTNLVTVVENQMIVFPHLNQPFIRKQHKLYVDFAEESMTLEQNKKSTQYLKFTDEILSRWNQILKYDDDIEFFIRELKNINDRHSHVLEFDSKGLQVLWESKSLGTSESIKISVKSIYQGLCGLKEIYKDFCSQLEKRRSELTKVYLDNTQIGKELEQCLNRDAKKLQALANEDKMLQRYHEEIEKRPIQFIQIDDEKLLQEQDQDYMVVGQQDEEQFDKDKEKERERETKDKEGIKQFYQKQKSIAKHFFSEVKSNVKNISSIGQLVSTVGQTVNNINKFSSLSPSQYKEKQERVQKQCETLFVVMGFTLKNIDELMIKHHRIVSTEKKNILLDFCALAQNLNTHFRKIIDEMSFRIKETQIKKEISTHEPNVQSHVLSNISAHIQPQIQVEEKKLDTPLKKITSSNDIISCQKIISNESDIKVNQFQKEIEESIQTEEFGDKDTVKQLDKLLKVLFFEWKENLYFKTKLQKIIHKSLNKKRPSILEELVISDFQVNCDTVELNGLHSQNQDDLEWMCDMDLNFRGEIKLLIETKIIINWPRENYARLPVKINVSISGFNGRMRVCLVPIQLGKSWISFMGQPVVNMDLQPILAYYNITNIPSVSEIMREFINQKIKLLTYPNKCTIDMPMTASSKTSKTKKEKPNNQ